MKSVGKSVVLLLLITAATAGSTAATPTPAASTPEDAGCNQPITDELSLCSETYQNGTAEIVVYADEPMAVTITDALGWAKGDRKEIARKQGITLDPGKNTLTLPATKWKEHVVITVDTGEALVPVFVERQSDDLGVMPGGPRSIDPVIAGGTVFGLFAVGLPLSVLLVRREKGVIDDVF